MLGGAAVTCLNVIVLVPRTMPDTGTFIRTVRNTPPMPP